MTRFEKKVDKIIWTIITLIPLIVFIVSTWNNPSTTTFNDTMALFEFKYISDIINKIFINGYAMPTTLTAYLSYFCVVEIMHVFIDFIVFIPRFAQNFLGGIYAKK